jgi:hypothetical protein
MLVLAQTISLAFGQVKKKVSKPIRQTPAKVESNATKAPPRKQAFDATGFKRPQVFSYIHDGRFERLGPLKLQVDLTLGTYLREFSNKCYSSLPPNREEITYLVQNYETQMTTLLGGRGQIVGAYSTRVPTDQTVVKTGVYADPELAAAYRRAIAEIDLILSKRMLNAMVNRQEFDYADLVEFAVDLPSDVTTLITNHGCKGQVVTTFSENIRRVIQSQPSIQAERGEPSFLERECLQKLPAIFPGVKASACKCLSREFKRNEILSRLDDLEDQFALDTFVLATFSKAGLPERVSTCMR